jgi:protochlorophyllide reductase
MRADQIARRPHDAGLVAGGVRPQGLLRDHPRLLPCADRLDLADLSQVAAFADRFRAAYGRLDLLVNNAGLAQRAPFRTRDGFEIHLGVNHLGHMALTLHLLPALTAASGARVVTVTSGAHRFGRVRFDDGGRVAADDRGIAAYARSKLANLLFALELGRRLAAAGRGTLSLAADPGLARTGLTRRDGGIRAVRLLEAALRPVSQSAYGGARPSLRAATDPGAAGGQLYAPRRGLRGAPVPARPGREATDPVLAARLWDASLAMLELDEPDVLRPGRT